MITFKDVSGNQLLSPEDEHYEDILSAYNVSGMGDDSIFKFKTILHLEDELYPYNRKIKIEKRNNEEDQKAFGEGSARLVHEDLSKGMKIFRITNQAVGGSSWKRF
jgi:hypothetical protein